MVQNIAQLIDHTLLKSDATIENIKTLCEEAKAYQFASVCVNPIWVKYAHTMLADTDVKVCTVIGFPLGANTPEVKAFETINAIENGAQEIDMVINIGALKNNDLTLVERDIAAVCAAADGKALVKVIIETALLTDEEKVTVCKIAKSCGAHFVKTSTGFSSGGATVEDIQLMRKTVGADMGIKASGGIKTSADVHNLVKAGATRIGASSGVAITRGLTSKADY